MSTTPHTRIVILGAGFGGLYTAMHLDRTLARDPNVEITLINRENFFLFTPMLHEVAASDLDLTHIVSPIRKLLRHVNFFNGRVESIDLDARRVHVTHGDGHHHHVLAYDHLVIALGAITNFFNLPGLEERALTMKSLGDAIYLRNRLIENLEQADFECDPAERASLLNFVVAGGGFAGVETLAGLNDFVREALRFYPHLDEAMLRVVLVHPGEVVLPELGERLGAYAQKKLAARGVEIRTKTRVTGVTDGGVTLSDGTTIQTNTLVWTAGTSPNPLLAALPCQKQNGRLVVDEYMEVPDCPGVWALGDAAVIPDPKTGKPYPPTAQHALREGRVLAHNLTAAVRGGKKKAFAFSTLGQLAAIGRRTGVANMFGVNFSGFIAWFLWRTIYLGKLPRFEKRVRVALDWTLDLLFSKDLVQFMTLRAPTVSHTDHMDHNHSSDAARLARAVNA
ncbi:MAG TPA: NAD(P)/FAD-dependent oxidoreductase [Candidatus Binatia bacterium]|nr:NAD(P)/FAD-dependent oxidoreductase [Candidatus Binatia bacterium]